VKKCPEIKKRIEKPQFKHEDVKVPLESFIKKNMRGPDDLQVLTIKRDKSNFIVFTNSSYCETIKGTHENVTMSYNVKGKEIKQVCPHCKKNSARTHCLTQHIIKILKQK